MCAKTTKNFFAILAFFAFGSIVDAQAASDVSAKAFNTSLVSHTDGSAGVFSAEPDGSIAHVQSGFICPAELPSFQLVDLQIYSKPPNVGADVGCDYARLVGDNIVLSKLAIFFVKVPNDTSLDSAFDKYKGEIVAAHPSSVEMKAALQIGQRTDYRAVGYAITESGRTYHSELIVGLANGWIIEVRATYPNSVIHATPETTRQDLADQLNDIKNTYVAYMQVMQLK